MSVIRTSCSSKGFSLVEIMITLGIISTVVVALLAILPVGMKSADDAGHKTIVSAVLEDIHNRIEGNPLEAGKLADSPFFYSREGVFVPKNASEEEQADRLYRAEIEIVAIDPANRPANTSTNLMAAQIKLWWPINPKTGERIRRDTKAQATVTYYVTSLTGNDWKEIDKRYEPKIEF